jgi:hypothetical protein
MTGRNDIHSHPGRLSRPPSQPAPRSGLLATPPHDTRCDARAAKESTP